MHTPRTRTPSTEAPGRRLIHLTALQLISVVSCATVTAAGAASVVFARSAIAEVLLISVVIAGATGSASLLALGRTARAKHIEERVEEIGAQLPDLQEDSRANSQLTHEILDIMRSMTAERQHGGDTGPQPIQTHR